MSFFPGVARFITGSFSFEGGNTVGGDLNDRGVGGILEVEVVGFSPEFCVEEAEIFVAASFFKSDDVEIPLVEPVDVVGVAD